MSILDLNRTEWLIRQAGFDERVTIGIVLGLPARRVLRWPLAQQVGRRYELQAFLAQPIDQRR
jgi:hypothetical protein